MPIFDYQCTKCDKIFDIYHRGKEKVEKIVCPSCGSSQYKKLVSVPSAVGGGTHDSGIGSCQSGPAGGCCGGMCGLN